MKTAEAALLVSILSAGVTLGGLVWQFALYKLSGSRIRVRMRAIAFSSEGGLLQGPEKSWSSTGFPEVLGATHVRIEGVKIQVTNVGRTPISVSDVALDLGRSRNTLFGRRTVRGIPVGHFGGYTEEFARLEAGDTLHVFFDFWEATSGLLGGERGQPLPVRVRATATPAVGRPVRSPRRVSWLIQDGQDRLDPTNPWTPESRAFAQLWRGIQGDSQPHEWPGWWIHTLSLLRGGSGGSSIYRDWNRLYESANPATATQVVRAWRDLEPLDDSAFEDEEPANGAPAS